MGNPLISDEELRQVVAESRSISDVLRKLGKTKNGVTHTHYSNRIKDAGISIDHFRKVNRGSLDFGKKTPEEILVKNEYLFQRVKTPILRRAMRESGVKNECGVCGQKPRWNGKPLMLPIDHEDGDWKNNSIENLRFLCPNCHSQTETFGNKRKPPQCSFCGDPIGSTSKLGLCQKHIPRATKIDWPLDSDLADMVRSSSRVSVAQQLGVSETAVRKRIKNHNIMVNVV